LGENSRSFCYKRKLETDSDESLATDRKNTFLFAFKYEWEKTRILEGRPWVFDGHLVSLLEFDGFMATSKLVFEKAAFWVRMYNLPLACMGKEMGYQIGGSVGEVEDVEVDEDGVGWVSF
jgi:hypothetical protein